MLSFNLIRIRILASKCRLKTLKKCSNRLILRTYILACHLQIDAHLDVAYHFGADPDPDPICKI
jgi:hypothetical protein